MPSPFRSPAHIWSFRLAFWLVLLPLTVFVIATAVPKCGWRAWRRRAYYRSTQDRAPYCMSWFFAELAIELRDCEDMARTVAWGDDKAVR